MSTTKAKAKDTATAVGSRSAASRTVDLFSGKTKLEEQQAALEEVPVEAIREPFTGIEGEVDRWREAAFVGQEWTTGIFYAGQLEQHQKANSYNGYRLTDRKGWLYLESVHRKGEATVHHYSGVMFPTCDLMALTEAFIRACWGKDREATKALFKEVCK